MNQENQELLNRFNKVLNTLTPAKRKELYDYLKSMNPEDRNKAVASIVKKYEDSNIKAHVEESAAEVAREINSRPGNKLDLTENEENSKETKSAAKKEKPAEKISGNKDVSPKQVDSSRKPKRRLKRKVKYALAGIISLIVIGILAAIIVPNREKISAKLGIGTDATETTIESVIETSVETTEATTAETTPAETPTPSPTPAPTDVPLAANAPDLTGLVVVLDPGHQEVPDEETESCASWLSISKPRCTAGAEGSTTGVPEYELTLEYALVIRNYLEQCGATVILTRDTNDVNISNQERAQIAVDNEADIFIRIHMDSANDSAATGVRVYVPDSGSYVSNNVAWGDELGNAIATAEGLDFDGTRDTYLYTGLNYANTIPSFQVSLGFLSNSDNESVLLDELNSAAVAQAIADFCVDFI